MHGKNLQKQDDPCVGHGVRQSQDSTSHDCIAQVEDGHPKRGFPLKLRPMQDRGEKQKCCLIVHASTPYILHMISLAKAKWLCLTYICEARGLLVIHA